MEMAWSWDEVLKLIEIWGDSAIQAQLEGCKRNQDVYDRIAADLRDAGFECTGKQCREKIKKLKGEYRKIKDTSPDASGVLWWPKSQCKKNHT